MRFTLLLVTALVGFILLAMLGGSAASSDAAVILYFVGWRADNPETTGLVISFTQLGDGPVLLAIGAAVVAWLALKRAWRDALMLALVLGGGRIGIEALKLVVDRPRPSFDAHPVETFSHSFPSGHAGNSMITFGALALVLAPPAWRRRALAGGVALALAIGATRPMLGVHWPSDVIGGWLFGLALLSLLWRWQSARTEA